MTDANDFSDIDWAGFGRLERERKWWTRRPRPIRRGPRRANALRIDQFAERTGTTRADVLRQVEQGEIKLSR